MALLLTAAILLGFPRLIAAASDYVETTGNGRPKLNEERVIIIGASSGIGKSVALKYARRGARLILCARRKAELNAVAENCREIFEEHSHNSTTLVHTMDITSLTDIRNLARVVRKNADFLGRIDTLILCSGVISVLPYEELMDLEGAKAEWIKVDDEVDNPYMLQRSENADAAFEKVMRVNLFGPASCVRELLPGLIMAKGNIMIVSSLSGRVGVPTRSLYSSSKHAVQGFFDSLRIEVARYGVHVATICPSTVNTDLRSSAVDLAHSKKGEDVHVVHGSVRGKESPDGCASVIIQASDRRLREVDPVQALQEMAQVCKPDGKIIMLEHGKAGNGWPPDGKKLDELLDKSAKKHQEKWGCEWNRDIMGAIHEAGLEVDVIKRWHFGTTYYNVVAKPPLPASYSPPQTSITGADKRVIKDV